MSTVSIGGLDFSYEVRGAGAPLLLIAGTGYPGATWLLPAFVDELARHHHVITYDHRGTGRTAGTSENYSTRQFAADAAALLRALDVGPAHVLGHSMGGRVAQWLALDEPAAVRTLILAATGSGGSGNPNQPVGLPVPAMAAMVEQGYRGYMARHVRETFFTPSFADAHLDRVQWLVNAFWDNRPSIRDYLKHIAARQNHDTSARLAEVALPALVLVGDADVREGPTGSHVDQSLHLAEQLPASKLVTLPGLSHGMFWQDPPLAVDAVVSWTAQHDAEPAHG
jgi:pimeloyl-ACP methyl ester carboxylesterase